MTETADGTPEAPARLFSFAAVGGGVFSGIVGTAIGHPLDTVKTRLQQTGASYRGMFDCFGQIIRKEGGRALFKGLGPPMLTMTVTNAVSFGTYSFFNSLLGRLSGTGDFASGRVTEAVARPDWHYFLAGALTAFSCTPLTTPSEVLKIQMQLDSKRYRNAVECARELIRNSGRWSILYRGYLINGLREIVFVSVYFGMYEVANIRIGGALRARGQDGYAELAVPVAGGCAGALAWIASFPLDVIKSNVQADLTQPGTITRCVAVARRHYAAFGLGGFYRGLGPSVTRAFLVSSTRFTAFAYAFGICRGLEERLEERRGSE